MANNKWGQGAWGINNWGDKADVTISITGFSATLSQGSTIEPTAEINEGWGRLFWGENAWGVAGDIVALGQSMSTSVGGATAKFGSSDIPTGQNLVSAIGSTSIEIAVEPSVTGQALASSIGSAHETSGDANVSVTGISSSLSINGVTIDDQFLIEQGWGRGTWGNRVWGGNYSVIVSGQSMSLSQGAATAKTDVDISVSGFDLITITQGLSSIKIDGNITVFASEDQLDLSLGQQTLEQTTNESVSGQALSGSLGTVVPEPKIPVDVTGISTTLSLGSISLVQTTNESVTGQAATLSVGQVAQETRYSVTTAGLLNSAIGSVSVVGTAAVPVTGIGLTANIGSVNVTAWSEIDPGVNNVWTEVDRAA